MKNVLLIGCLCAGAVLSPGCATLGPSTVASEASPGFRVGLQETEPVAPAGNDDTTDDSTDDTNPPDMVGVTVPQQPLGDAAAKQWHFGVAPYIWAASVKGNGAIKGTKGEVDASFSDILSNLDIGGMLVVEARQGDTVFRLDQDYLAISSDTKDDGVKVDSDGSLYVGTITAGQILGDGERDDPEVFIGARYWRLHASVELKQGGAKLAKGKGTEDWWDAIIGVRKHWSIDERWGIVTMGNVGGFGIGSSSDGTWGGMVAASRRTESGDQFLVGYRHLVVDKNKGSGANEFDLHVRFTGPILGWAFRF